MASKTPRRYVMDTGLLEKVIGKLDIELSEPSRPMSSTLMNQVAPEHATIKSVSFSAQIYEKEEVREVLADEWKAAVIDEAHMDVRGESGRVMGFDAPNGRFFTLSDLKDVVERLELATRGDSEWFGGVDVHHVYFDGISREADGAWSIFWGS